tara:strand:- start:262 stop:549 length:288 start_codon:yes stop_codon:yes gene_type:complete
MSKNFIQTIAIILGIFIVIAFTALIYGVYMKITTSTNNITEAIKFFSADLAEGERIKDIQVLDDDRLLILIEKNQNIKGAIYNISKNSIIRTIDK